jgi:hypothetical protein
MDVLSESETTSKLRRAITVMANEAALAAGRIDRLLNAAGAAYGLCDSGGRLSERIKYVADRAETARFNLDEIEEILRGLAILFPDEDMAPVGDR